MSVGMEFRSGLALAGGPVWSHSQPGQGVAKDSLMSPAFPIGHNDANGSGVAVLPAPVSVRKEPVRDSRATARMHAVGFLGCAGAMARSKVAHALSLTQVREFEGIPLDGVGNVVLWAGLNLALFGDRLWYRGVQTKSEAQKMLALMLVKDVLISYLIFGTSDNGLGVGLMSFYSMFMSYTDFKRALRPLSYREMVEKDLEAKIVPDILKARQDNSDDAPKLEQNGYQRIASMLADCEKYGDKKIQDRLCSILAKFATWRCPYSLREPLQRWFNQQLQDQFAKHWAADEAAGATVKFDVARDAPTDLLTSPVFGLEQQNVLIEKAAKSAGRPYFVTATSVPTKIIDPDGRVLWLQPGKTMSVASHVKVVLVSLGHTDLSLELP